jgi:hypothetical protein
MPDVSITPEIEGEIALAVSNILERHLGAKVPFVLIFPTADIKQTRVLSELNPLGIARILESAYEMVSTMLPTSVLAVDEGTGQVTDLGADYLTRDPKKQN